MKTARIVYEFVHLAIHAYLQHLSHQALPVLLGPLTDAVAAVARMQEFLADAEMLLGTTRVALEDPL